LEQAYEAELDRAPESVRRPLPGGGSGYLRNLRHLRDCYGFLVSPDNASRLPQSASDSARLDRLFSTDIWRALDCIYTKSAALNAATNVVELLVGLL
jgi:hypothetical protein